MNVGILPPKSNFPISLPIFSFRKPACRFRSDRNRSSWARQQGRAVYLLFDEAHAQRPREDSGKVLTPDRLAGLPSAPKGFEDIRVVCRRWHRIRRSAEGGARGGQANPLSSRGGLRHGRGELRAFVQHG